MTANSFPDPADDGLGLSDITRHASEQANPRPNFPSPAELDATASAFPAVPENPTADDFAVFIAGAVFGTTRTRKDKRGENHPTRQRGAVKEWTPESKRRMVRTLCELDYSPMFPTGEELPAMITLTYPNDWRRYAPTPDAHNRFLDIFRKRYETKWGTPLVCVWKREWQKRGAVHQHIFFVPPAPLREFREWLSQVWADIVVGDPDAPDYASHLKWGANVSRGKFIHATDPFLLAIYFLKHSAPNVRKASKKGYQNRPPKEWLDGGKVGRYWGYWGLRKQTVQVRISREDWVKVARLLKGWAKAHGRSKPHKVFVPTGYDLRTGEVFGRRITRKRDKPSRFLVVRGATVFANDIARYLQDLHAPKPPVQPFAERVKTYKADKEAKRRQAERPPEPLRPQRTLPRCRQLLPLLLTGAITVVAVASLVLARSVGL